ncbi:YutD family protein [Paenibacillus sp. 481]|uniref:YutD family protein n=1 Tax=Paenibacillus sp. 481 TaxID=2835869 RepID=UPI001E2A2EAF|nr:YutD family protein [Paenibacillus sp. 481]UHA74658.1 DUF1027 domain-containing protein [Paenibacillus sp. 481]
MIHIGGKMYDLVHEHRTAWNPEAFRDRYSEVLERYDYILGDWGYSQLRLKGFFKDNHPKSTKESSFSSVMDYVNEYCNFGCAYFILEKVSNKDARWRPPTEESDWSGEQEGAAALEEGSTAEHGTADQAAPQPQGISLQPKANAPEATTAAVPSERKPNRQRTRQKPHSKSGYQGASRSEQAREGRGTGKDRDSREAKDVKDNREGREQRDSKAAQETKAASEAKSAQGSRPAQEAKVAHQARPTQEAKTAHQARPTQEAKATQETRPTQEAKAAQQARPAQEAKVAQETRPTQEAKVAQQARPTQEAKAAQQTRPAQEAKATQETRPTQEAKDTKDARTTH